MEALSETSERQEDVDGGGQDEADDKYRELPWGSASSPAAVAEVAARILATDDQLRPRAEVRTLLALTSPAYADQQVKARGLGVQRLIERKARCAAAQLSMRLHVSAVWHPDVDARLMSVVSDMPG